MKKILLSALCCMLAIIGMQAQTTVTGVAKDFYGTTTTDIKTDYVVDGYITLSFAKNGGSTAPAFNKAGDIRAYAKNTITATCASGNITKIVFKISAQGKKRLTDLTPSTGTVTIDKTNRETVTWEGSAETVVFTVGEKAVYGTDGSSKAGQIDFTEVEITYGSASSGATLEMPTASVEPGVIYNAANVELSATDGEIHYTIDGSIPTAESPIYSEAISIDQFGSTTTIKAIAIDGGEFSEVATFSYTLKVAAPAFSKEPGVYEKINYTTGYLVISCETEGSKINYTTNGNDPKEDIAFYLITGDKNVSVLKTSTVKAAAFVIVESDTIWSETTTKTYTISTIDPFKVVSEITSGSKYLINTGNIVATPIYEDKTSNYLYKEDVTVNNGYSIITFDHYAFTFTATETEGEYTIQDAYGRTIYMQGTYNGFYASKDAIEGDSTIWTVSIDSNNNATITNKGKGKTMQYNAQYGSYGAYASITHTLPTLFEKTTYPTFTISPEDYSEHSEFPTITVTCESGIICNQSSQVYATFYTGWDYSTTTALFGEVSDDGKSVTFAPTNIPTGSNDYTVTFPAGLFTLDPNGLSTLSEEGSVTFTVNDPNSLELTYTYLEDYSNVSSLSMLYFEYSHNIIDNVSDAVITDMMGNEYPLQVTYEEDPWGGTPGWNALCLKLEEPITEPGMYSFVLKKEYASSEQSGSKLTEDIYYTFIIAEPFKVISSTPESNSNVESISDIYITFNKQPYFMAEGFYMMDSNYENSYIFSVAYEDADGNELPENTARLVCESTITAPGTYYLFIEEYNIYNYDMMTGSMTYLDACEFTFTIGGESEETGVVGDITGDGSVNVGDVTSIVAMILDDALMSDKGDVNNDGSVNVGDVTSIVSIILDPEAANAPARAAATRSADAPVVSAEFDEENNMYINVSNPDYPFTAIQFDLTIEGGIGIVNDGEYYDVFLGSRTSSRNHSQPECAVQPDGSLRVVILSLKNKVFNGTEGDVATVSLDATGVADGSYSYSIKNIVLSDPQSVMEYPADVEAWVNVAGGVTGINSIAADGENANEVIYDLSGRKVANPVKGGIYIKGGKKIIM